MNTKMNVVCVMFLVGLAASSVSAFSVAGSETVPLSSPPVPAAPESDGLLSLNLQQLATLAMNPLLNNQSLRQLYGQAVEIINSTGADSVLLQLDPLTANETAPAANQSVMVLAVDNPNEAAHQDLLTRFRLYFVNLTSPQDFSSTPAGRMFEQAATNIADNTGNLWSIFNNFIKNQANAAIGAAMMPLNVGASAFHHAVSQHAEYVTYGSNFGSSLAAPIILRAVALPNQVNQYFLNVTGNNLARVQNFEQVSKQASSAAVDMASDTVLTGAHLVTRFAIRPIAAFTGFNLQLLGGAMSRFGTGISNTGLGLNILGNGLNNGAVTAVSAGATAIAWAMDNSTYGQPPSTVVEPQAQVPQTLVPLSNVVEVNNNNLNPLEAALFDASFNDTSLAVPLVKSTENLAQK